MKRFSILAITLCAICGSAFGQQALFGGQMPLSPEIHADKTVTFRCMAPEAHKVQITSCQPRKLIPRWVSMICLE